MHDGLRGQRQDNDGGNSKSAECERRPIQHDADQYDRNHDERALRCDFRTG